MEGRKEECGMKLRRRICGKPEIDGEVWLLIYMKWKCLMKM
jgi:hypothetical protein